MNHYQRLNVSHGATQAEIEKAYRKLVLTYHPDKGGDYNMFLEIQKSYSFLSDRHKKEFYDMFGDSWMKNDSMTYMLTRLFTKRNVFLYSICIFLLLTSILALPLCIFFDFTIYIIPQVLLSQALMTIAAINGVKKLIQYPKTKITVLMSFILLTISHIFLFFTILWLSGYINCVLVILFYFIIDFAVSLGYYIKTINKYTFLHMIVRLIIVISGFLVSNNQIKLLIASVHVIQIFVLYSNINNTVYSIPILNYICSLYFSFTGQNNIILIITCSLNFFFVFLLIVVILFRMWRRNIKISPLLKVMSDIKQLK
ncbi:DnaJ like protein [Dictyocoela muelleri]|nr:DnaJ like protein [Dictyocoela muelleri]